MDTKDKLEYIRNRLKEEEEQYFSNLLEDVKSKFDCRGYPPRPEKTVLKPIKVKIE